MTEVKPEVMTLDSGLRIVMVPMESIKSLTVLAMVGVGSRFEDPQVAGISHFLEHLPFKGTKNYPTSLDVATAIDGVGGKHNAFTGKEYTGYWVKVASGQWKLALDMVSDLLLTARLRDEDIEREKGVIVEEINMYEDQPQAKVSNLFDELVFAGSGLERQVIGFKETVTSLGADDFRAHWDQWYDPNNVVVGLVGDLSKLPGTSDKVQALIDDYFSKGGERAGGGEKKVGVKKQSKPRLTVFYKDTEQAHFHLGFPAIRRDDPDRYVLSVLTTLLGGNSSSRLFNEIREKRGLAYYAYASADVYEDAGSMYAFEGVSLNKIEEAIKVTKEEFVKVAQGSGISEDEVQRAKEYVVGKLTLDLENSATLANLVVRKLLLEQELVTLEKLIKEVRAVDRERVAALAAKLVDWEQLNLAVVGPYKDEGKFKGLISSK